MVKQPHNLAKNLPKNLHATALKFNFGKNSLGVLLMGPSGSGKSFLSLQMLRENSMDWDSAELISDDQILLERHNGKLIAFPPPTIAGKIELRGYGIIDKMPYVTHHEIHLVTEFCEINQISRMPEAKSLAILGIQIPTIKIPKHNSNHAMMIINQILQDRSNATE